MGAAWEHKRVWNGKIMGMGMEWVWNGYGMGMEWAWNG